jgi:hypothetical protein
MRHLQHLQMTLPSPLRAHRSEYRGTKLTSSSEGTVRVDLSEAERPLWLLSAFGLGKADANMPGLQDVSPEEMHYRYMLAAAANDASQYVRRQAEGLTSC